MQHARAVGLPVRLNSKGNKARDKGVASSITSEDQPLVPHPIRSRA